MQYHYFRIPVRQPKPQATALNSLLQKNPQASVDQQLIDSGVDSVWAVCVRVETVSAMPMESAASGKRSAVDYREVLSPQHFDRFAILREQRNQMAKDRGIKPYSIFSNRQLADIALMDNPDKASIAALEGVGQGRVEQYAEIMIALLNEQPVERRD